MEEHFLKWKQYILEHAEDLRIEDEHLSSSEYYVGNTKVCLYSGNPVFNAGMWLQLENHQLRIYVRNDEGEKVIWRSFTEGQTEGPVHQHDFVEIGYVVQGCATQSFFGKDHEFKQGDFWLVDRHCYHSDKYSNENLFTVYIGIPSDVFDSAFVACIGNTEIQRFLSLALLEQNAHRAAEQTATVPEYPRNIRERLQGKKAVQTTPEKDGIQRMVDRAAKRAEGKGAGYDRWAAVHNLKQMAATVAAYGQYGYSPEELDAALVSANADLQDSTAKLKALDAAIREKKELQTQVLAYAKTKPARDGLKAQKTEKARSTYRERHESDFIIADAATRYFRAHGVSKLPSHKALQAEIEQLTAEKNAHYNEYREKKARVKELHTVKSNLSQILQGEKDREKKHEHER